MPTLNKRYLNDQKTIYSSMLPLIRAAGLSAITVSLPPDQFAIFTQDLDLGGIVFHNVEDFTLSEKMTFSDGIGSLTFEILV